MTLPTIPCPIQTFARVRPISFRENTMSNAESCLFPKNENIIMLSHPDTGTTPDLFSFNRCYWTDALPSSSQTLQNLYKDVGTTIIDNAMEGISSTVIVMGAPGAGKTYTLEADTAEDRGLVLRVLDGLFARLGTAHGARAVVTLSCTRMYMEHMMDELNPAQRSPMRLREHPTWGTYVQGLTCVEITSAADGVALLAEAARNRAIYITKTSARSSRFTHFHTLCVYLTRGAGAACETSRAQITFTDLTILPPDPLTQPLLRESSLLLYGEKALRDVVQRLLRSTPGKRPFVPYRNSKITRVLKDSLGGSAQTFVVAAVSPSALHHRNSADTLSFVEIMAGITNHVVPQVFRTESFIDFVLAEASLIETQILDNHGTEEIYTTLLAHTRALAETLLRHQAPEHGSTVHFKPKE
eukprot:gnl/Chilomastix_cuspidata/6748.p1 GENE.gnl/Chilomastix_cuspidata/6748~~gnl/Chilomastix_cuspidata/6748.p1  ORF type:complete len:413 (+),score=51.87 gnl/Chilomastix_cuspidata/6748:683-1921(+)